MQGRNFSCIIYPDSDNIDCDLVFNCLPSFAQDYFYILHNKDSGNDESEIKDHFHIVLSKSTPSYISVVSNQLHIPPNLIQVISSKKAFVRYLVHKDNPEKAQYDISEVYTNNESYLKSVLCDSTEIDKVRIIFDYVNSTCDFSVTALSDFCIRNNCWAEFRRCFSLWQRLLYEAEVNYRKGAN